jgi:hypothetical protein
MIHFDRFKAVDRSVQRCKHFPCPSLRKMRVNKRQLMWIVPFVWESLKKGNGLNILQIAHSFHASCIDKWFQSHSNCPLCRCYVLQDHLSTSENIFDTLPETIVIRYLSSKFDGCHENCETKFRCYFLEVNLQFFFFCIYFKH